MCLKKLMLTFHLKTYSLFLIGYNLFQNKKKLLCNFLQTYSYVTECFVFLLQSSNFCRLIEKTSINNFLLVTVFKSLQVWLGISNKLRDLYMKGCSSNSMNFWQLDWTSLFSVLWYFKIASKSFIDEIYFYSQDILSKILFSVNILNYSFHIFVKATHLYNLRR